MNNETQLVALMFDLFSAVGFAINPLYGGSMISFVVDNINAVQLERIMATKQVTFIRANEKGKLEIRFKLK